MKETDPYRNNRTPAKYLNHNSPHLLHVKKQTKKKSQTIKIVLYCLLAVCQRVTAGCGGSVFPRSGTNSNERSRS